MPTIIISYRRSDSKWITGRIADRLERDYGKGDVFVDIDAIPLGMDFREHLRNVLDRCDVLLAIIGPNWLARNESGQPRIFDPTDWVRVEIETALAKNIPVIPVLIDRAPMPKLAELPESMHSFAFRQAADLDTGRDFHVHMDRLVRAISRSAAQRPIEPPSEPPAADRAIRVPLEPRTESQRPQVTQSPPQQDIEPRIPPPADVASRDRAPEADEETRPSGRRRWSRRGIIAAIAGAAGVAVLVAYVAPMWLEGPTPPQDAPTSPRSRILDRIEQSGGPPRSATQVDTVPKSQTTIAKSSPAPAPAVAQKAVLYEEDPGDPQGRRSVGSTIWRTERVSPGPGQPEELAVRAEAEVPERKLTMTLSLRRNADPTLPASHTIEVMFRLPKDFLPGPVDSVPGILLKEAENARGTPLKGLVVKVADNFYLMGLSNVTADLENNLRMLKERGWFDIAVVYSNKRRAILAIEKGSPGERAFAEAFAAWKQ